MRGLAKTELKLYFTAIKDYNKAIEIDPKCAEAYLRRGDVNGLFKQYHAAIKDYDKAIELDPKYAYAYVRRGDAKVELGHGKGMVRYQVREGLSVDEIESKRFLAAIKDYDKAIELDPKNVNAYLDRAEAKVALDQYSAAIKDFDKAIELEPKNVSAYYRRGDAKVELHQYSAANEDYDKAFET